MFYLIISFVCIGVLGLTLIFFLILYFYQSYLNRNISRGHLIYKVDLVRRKILLLSTNFNSSSNFSIFPHQIKINKWRNLDLFLKNFASSYKNLNKIKEILNYVSIDKNEKEISFNFKKNNLKNQYLIRIKVSPIYEESDFQLHLHWGKVYKKKLKHSLKNITQEEVVNNKNKFKGFVAFNINTNILNSYNYFLSLLNDNFKIKNHYFISQNLIVFPFFSSSSKKSQKKVSSFIEKISSKKNILGENRFFMGSAYVLTKNVHTTNRLSSFITFLKFCCILSSEENQGFISKKSYLFKNSEYLDYLKNLKSLKDLFRAKNFQIKSKPIIDEEKNKKIVNYYFPSLKVIEEKYKTIFLKDLVYKNLITNYFAQTILFDKNKDHKTFLIDVYDNWIIENYNQLFLKNVVYVINLHNKNKIPNDLTEVLNNLVKKGFIFALKVKKEHIIIENLMNSVDFKFFIIEHDFLNDFSYQKYIDLILVKNISLKKHIKMIFDGHNKNLDLFERKRIGFRYFY